MSTRRTIITALTALTAAALLAGCTGTPKSNDPTYTGAPTRTTTPTPTAAASAAPTQAPSGAPTSKADALQAANKVVQAEQQYLFDLESHPDLGAAYLADYAIGPELTGAKQIQSAYAQGCLYVTGQPVKFTPQFQLSYSTKITVTNEGNVTIPNGNVVLIGCLDNTNTHLLAKPGHSAPKFTNGRFPWEFTVQYDPSRKLWLIFQSETHTSGGLTC